MNNSYHFITRRDVIEQACKNLLRELYFRAQPSVDIDVYIEKFKNGELDPEKDRIYEWHYLPAAVESQVVDDYLVAYNADDQMKKWFEWLIELFKGGGHRTVYKDIFNTGDRVRTGEETEKLSELIGEENAEIVYKLMEDFLGFYRTNTDEHSIRSVVMQGPTSNPKTVIEKWGPIEIDESVYKNPDGNWDYTWHDYYNGKCHPIEDD